jgi:hypothetical protein
MSQKVFGQLGPVDLGDGFDEKIAIGILHPVGKIAFDLFFQLPSQFAERGAFRSLSVGVVLLAPARQIALPTSLIVPVNLGRLVRMDPIAHELGTYAVRLPAQIGIASVPQRHILRQRHVAGLRLLEHRAGAARSFGEGHIGVIKGIAKVERNGVLDVLILAADPHDEKKRHHRGHEVRVGHLPCSTAALSRHETPPSCLREIDPKGTLNLP